MEGNNFTFCFIHEEIDDLGISDVDLFILPAHREEWLSGFLFLFTINCFLLKKTPFGLLQSHPLRRLYL